MVTIDLLLFLMKILENYSLNYYAIIKFSSLNNEKYFVMKDFKNKVEYAGKLHVPITQIQQLSRFCHICLIHFFSSSFGEIF